MEGFLSFSGLIHRYLFLVSRESQFQSVNQCSKPLTQVNQTAGNHGNSASCFEQHYSLVTLTKPRVKLQQKINSVNWSLHQKHLKQPMKFLIFSPIMTLYFILSLTGHCMRCQQLFKSSHVQFSRPLQMFCHLLIKRELTKHTALPHTDAHIHTRDLPGTLTIIYSVVPKRRSTETIGSA